MEQKASLMAAFSSRLLFHPLLTVHGSLTFIGDATVALLSGRWLSFNWGQLINSRLDGQASVYKTVRGGDDDSLLSSYCSPSVSISSSPRHPVFLQRYTRQRHAPLISPRVPDLDRRENATWKTIRSRRTFARRFAPLNHAWLHPAAIFFPR